MKSEHPGRRGGQTSRQTTATDLQSLVALVPEAPELPGTQPSHRGMGLSGFWELPAL